MHLTWTTFTLPEPAVACPWQPEGAVFSQAGHSGRGRVEIPDFAGDWWSVLSTWPSAVSAVEAGARARAAAPGAQVWHVALEAASFRGDAVLSGGATPFSALPAAGKVAGAAAVVTLAGLGDDRARGEEFFARVVDLGQRVGEAPGARAALVQAPPDGAVLTFSAWSSLRDAVTWAYHRPRHAEAVARQEEAGLLTSSGFLRCAVRHSEGTLGDAPDPLAGLTGTVVPRRSEST